MTKSLTLTLLIGLSMTSLCQTVSIQFENEGPIAPRTPVSHLVNFEDQLFVGTGGMRVLEYDLEGELLGTIIDMPGTDVGPWSNLYIQNGNLVGHGGEAGYDIFVSEHAIDGTQLTYSNVTSGQSGTGELIDVDGDWHLLWASNCCGTGQTWDTELKKFSGHSDEVVWNVDLCYECNNWAGSCSHGQDYPMDLEFFDNHLFAFKSNVTSPCFNQIGIQKVDLSGGLQWSFEFPGEKSVVETIVHNDEMFVLGYADESPSRQPFLWKLNAQGEVIWEHVFFTEFSDMEPIDLVADANGNLRIGMIENGGFRLDEVSPMTGENITVFNIPIQQEIKSFGLYGNNLIQLGMNEFVLGYNWGSWYDGARFNLVKFSLGQTTGCTDPQSCNYNEDAEEDDGSCLPYDALVGCMDESACNFNVNALCADDSCIYPPFNLSNCDEGEATCGPGTMWDSTTQLCIVANPADTDFDGCVQLNDLLDLLSAYGSCGFDFIVEGCTDPEAENWQEDANQDDGSCTYPFAPSESDELVFEHYLDFTGPSSCTTPELSPGEYYLEFSGTWCGGSCWNNNTTDAAYNINHPYAEDPTIPVPVCHFTWNEYCPQDDNSCASYRPTPDVYNPEHVYYYPFTSQGGSETIYGVSDECCWGDNSGGLNLRVFKVN